MQSDLNNLVIDDLYRKDIDIGSILRINGKVFRTINTIIDRDTTNIHDIFSDGSSIATYPLDNTLKDLNGIFNATGDVSYVSGRYERAASLNSTLSHISLPISYRSIKAYSLWVKALGSIFIFSNSTDTKTLDDHLCVYIDGSGVINTLSNDGVSWVTTNIKLRKDMFEHIYVEVDAIGSGIIKIWVNNVYMGSYSTTTTAAGYYSQAVIGTYGGVGSAIDHIRVFNRRLTSDEIRSLYNEKKYIIPMIPPLSSLPSLVETVSSEGIYSSDTFYKEVYDETYDALEETLYTTRVYSVDDRVKNKTSNVIYKCIKPNTAEKLLSDLNFFIPTTGILIDNGILAYSNGTDDNTYLVTDVESVNIITNPNTIVNGYKYVAKYKDNNNILLEDREPIFTGFYEMQHSKDSRLVLINNAWYKNNDIPDIRSLIQTHTFNKPDATLTNWKVLGRSSTTTPWVVDIGMASITPLGVKILTTASSKINGAIETSIDIMKKGWYTIEIDMAEIMTQSVRIRAASTPIEGLSVSEVNTAFPDIVELGKHELSTLYTLKIWLTEGANYISIINEIDGYAGRYSTIKSCKLFNSDEYQSSSGDQTKTPAISFLGRYLFRDNMPIEKDTTWIPPKVMQEDTLINGKLTTTGNRVWKEIGTVYIGQRLVIENPFGNENWKDCDVKPYIFHPITKRWESLLFTNASGVSTSDGIACFSTSEGIVILTGNSNVVDIAPVVTGGSYPNRYIYYDTPKVGLVIDNRPKTKNI